MRLIALIQTGVLRNIADCVPRTLASEILVNEAGSNVKFLFKESGVSLTGGVPVRKLQSMNDFVDAYINTIVPALLSQPSALLNWNCLISTVSHLNSTHG